MLIIPFGQVHRPRPAEPQLLGELGVGTNGTAVTLTPL